MRVLHSSLNPHHSLLLVEVLILAMRIARLGWNTIIVWLLWTGAAWAAGGVGDLPYKEPMTAPVAPINMGAMLLQLVISLAVVIGLALILIKFLQRNTLLSRQSAWARIVDQVNMGPNKMLVLAEIFGKVYVLGVTDHGITTLLGENDIDLSQVRQVFAEVDSRKGRFLQTLDSKLGEFKKRYEDRRKDGSPR